MKKNSTSEKWVVRAVGNKKGTRFFIWVINTFGILPAYGFLFFASLQYLLFDKKAVNALCDYRKRLGFNAPLFSIFKHFYSFGVTLIDRVAFLTNRGKSFNTIHINEELINRELDYGNGVILLGAHFGNWEFAGNLLTKRIAARVHVFMYDAGNEASTERVSVLQNLVIHHVQDSTSDTAVEIVNALRAGDIVCMHGDRFFGNQRTETIDFLGEPARFPVGPMALAAITGASVITCFTVRTSFFHYTFSAEEPDRITNNQDRVMRDRQIRSALEKYVKVLERKCREYPYQWYNFYRFWDVE